MDTLQTDHSLVRNNSRDPGVFILIAALVYAVMIGVTEIVLVHLDVVLGFLGHVFLIPILLTHYATVMHPQRWRLLPVLALIPLLRVFSLVVVVDEVPELHWYTLAGIPLLLSAFLTIRLLGISYAELGLSIPPRWVSQFGIALTGIPLSWIAFTLLEPDPIVDRLSIGNIAAGVIVLTLFTGYTEEIIFRGLLRPLSNEILGGAGFLLTNGLFAIMYLGSFSPAYMIFMGLVGAFFGWCAEKTQSLWGIIMAHSMLSIGLLLIWP